jgi:dipeptide/tripeptide permease
VFVAVSLSTFLTSLGWVIIIYFVTLGLAAEVTHEALDPKIPALIVRPRPTVEQALYAVMVIVAFLTGLWMFLYAHLSWLFLVPVTVFTVLFLNNTKRLGKNRSRDKLETAYKIIMIYYVCLFWIFTAFFVWIPQYVGVL